VQHPVLLGLIVRVARLLPGLQALKGHALLVEQGPEALVADVLDHPLGDQEVGQLVQAPGGERQAMVLWTRQRDLLDLPALGQGEGGGPATAVAGYSESNPSRLKLWSTSRTRSSLVNVTWAILGAGIRWAASRTICARRQVTTEPLLRRTIRSSRLPS
jgi:hypothetical protein